MLLIILALFHFVLVEECISILTSFSTSTLAVENYNILPTKIIEKPFILSSSQTYLPNWWDIFGRIQLLEDSFKQLDFKLNIFAFIATIIFVITYVESKSNMNEMKITRQEDLRSMDQIRKEDIRRMDQNFARMEEIRMEDIRRMDQNFARMEEIRMEDIRRMEEVRMEDIRRMEENRKIDNARMLVMFSVTSAIAAIPIIVSLFKKS